MAIVSACFAPSVRWIPAFAGMTTEGVVADDAFPCRADRDRVARPALAVIPAKAGIHVAAFAQAQWTAATTPEASAVWIPAFAGMTTEGVGAVAALPCRADRDRVARRTLAVIPAKAGIHVDDCAQAQGTAATTPEASTKWIPAFAGMTTQGVVAAAALSVCAGSALTIQARRNVLRSNSRAR